MFIYIYIYRGPPSLLPYEEPGNLSAAQAWSARSRSAGGP